MDTTLVTVSVLSVGMAAALSVIVWRMLRDERQRSDARVAALAELAAQPAVLPSEINIRSRDSARSHRPVSSVQPETASPPLDLPIREAPVSSGGMFVHAERSSPWGTRIAVMAGLVLVVASVILFALAAKGSVPVSHAAPAAQAGTATPQSAAAGGLELLSLRDSRQPDTLTITGMVQNPRAGVPLSRVTVTAYTFDEKGSFLASGRALIDVTALAPGDESPFVVTVPVTDTVARYRIGFRTEDGRVLAHVDKRQQGPIAANW
jgi:hypothetical protein